MARGSAAAAAAAALRGAGRRRESERQNQTGGGALCDLIRSHQGKDGDLVAHEEQNRRPVNQSANLEVNK